MPKARASSSRRAKRTTARCSSSSLWCQAWQRQRLAPPAAATARIPACCPPPRGDALGGAPCRARQALTMLQVRQQQGMARQQQQQQQTRWAVVAASRLPLAGTCRTPSGKLPLHPRHCSGWTARWGCCNTTHRSRSSQKLRPEAAQPSRSQR